ncbi:hypothetical protein Cgig2_021534 [Carnegiea gigantea]|uniref:Uncharacterized protein n=1 Tax=Carnegiea gigantea TaxID=171969 RepID=A0A9Q1KE64_9CARY|nr:hypothetical protein Cgig2_021534 [Carnegiea gigantea]
MEREGVLPPILLLPQIRTQKLKLPLILRLNLILNPTQKQLLMLMKLMLIPGPFRIRVSPELPQHGYSDGPQGLYSYTVFENSTSAPDFHRLPSHGYRVMELAHGAGQIFRDFIRRKTTLFRCKRTIPNPGGLMTKLGARQGGPVRDDIVTVMILFYLLQMYGCIVDWRPVRSPVRSVLEKFICFACTGESNKAIMLFPKTIFPTDPLDQPNSIMYALKH